MNNNRRKEIKRVIDSIRVSTEMLESILADEEEAFENMPEGLQNSDNGMMSEEAQEQLSNAIVALEEAIEYLEEI